MLVKASAWSLTITNSINQCATKMKKIKTPEANYSQAHSLNHRHVMLNLGCEMKGMIAIAKSFYLPRSNA